MEVRRPLVSSLWMLRASMGPAIVVGLLMSGACGSPAPPPVVAKPAATARGPAPASTASTASGEPGPGRSAVLLVTVNGEKRCVAFTREQAPDAASTLSLVAGDACRPATMRLTVEPGADGAVARGASLTHAYPRVPGVVPAAPLRPQMCGGSDAALREYPSMEACEGGASPSFANACLQVMVEAAFQVDPRLARVDDRPLQAAMRGGGSLYMPTGKARTCAAWTFEPSDADPLRGAVRRHFTRNQVTVDLLRSYAYDAACKSFAFTSFSVAEHSSTGGVGHGGGGNCKVKGLVEDADGDRVVVGDLELFLTEAACKASVARSSTKKGGTRAYVAEDDGC